MAVTEKPFTGLTACVKLGKGEDAVPLAYISGFSLSLSRDIIEILGFGMQYKEKVPSIKDWTASVDGTIALVTGGSQEKLLHAFETGEELTFATYLNDTTFFEGVGYVSSFEVEGAPDDAITLSSEIAGSGAVIATIPAAT